MDRRRFPLAGTLTACCVALSLGNAAWSAWDQGWTYDEAYHLLWSERLLESGVTERTSQERLNSKTPISVPNVLARQAARAAGVTDERALRFAARLPNILWLAVLLAAVGQVARRRFGEATALIAVAAAALEPSLVAHASVAASDLPFGRAWAFPSRAKPTTSIRRWWASSARPGLASNRPP